MGTPSLALLPPVAPVEPAVGHKRPPLQAAEQNGTAATSASTPQKKSRPTNAPYALVQADEEIRYGELADHATHLLLLVLIVCPVRSLKRKTPVHDTVTSRRRMPVERISAAMVDEFAKESMASCSILSFL